MAAITPSSFASGPVNGGALRAGIRQPQQRYRDTVVLAAMGFVARVNAAEVGWAITEIARRGA